MPSIASQLTLESCPDGLPFLLCCHFRHLRSSGLVQAGEIHGSTDVSLGKRNLI